MNNQTGQHSGQRLLHLPYCSACGLESAETGHCQACGGTIVLPSVSFCGWCGRTIGECSFEPCSIRKQAAQRHRCSGCGLRWQGEASGAELCGDCWRKAQPSVHAKDEDAVEVQANGGLQAPPRDAISEAGFVLSGRLVGIILKLKVGKCWCQKGIGNPFIDHHSAACQAAAEAVGEKL